jgi:hypothetical protein
MLGLIPRSHNGDHERARLIAAGALALLAVLAFVLIMTLPHRADLAPPALRAGRIMAFSRDVAECQAALAGAGFQTEALPAKDGPGACGYANAVELTQSLTPYSGPVAASCGMAAGLALWERDVVARAAERHLHQAVARIELAGAPYQCRQIAGRRDHRLSEHAHANAVDIGGFTLADGRVLTVRDGWRSRSASDRAFLRAVRNGACPYFQAVLSPDYNRAHHDHLHFDLGRDKLCR